MESSRAPPNILSQNGEAEEAPDTDSRRTLSKDGEEEAGKSNAVDEEGTHRLSPSVPALTVAAIADFSLTAQGEATEN